MYDPLDPLIMESFRLQPAELGPIQALRATMQAVFGSLSDDELTEISQKGKLMTTVPELRSKALDELVRSFDVFAKMVAERIGKPSEDLTVRVVAGAIMGVMMSVLFTVPQDHPMNLFNSMDAALGQMEKLLAL